MVCQLRCQSQARLKEAQRAVFAAGLAPTLMELIDRWCSRAQRSRIPEFVKTGAMIRRNTEGIDATIGRAVGPRLEGSCTSTSAEGCPAPPVCLSEDSSCEGRTLPGGQRVRSIRAER